MNFNLRKKMIKKFLQNELIQNIVGFLISLYIKVCFHTSLWYVRNNKSSLVIAHRLSTILDADKIILLHRGKVEAVGKHNFLLKNSKIYKNLYELQFKE